MFDLPDKFKGKLLPDPPPEPVDENRKKPSLTCRHSAILFILFVLVLAGLFLWESQQLREAELQKQRAALCESRGEHYRYREGTCQLRVWVCTEFQTSTGYEEECKY